MLVRINETKYRILLKQVHWGNESPVPKNSPAPKTNAPKDNISQNFKK